MPGSHSGVPALPQLLRAGLQPDRSAHFERDRRCSICRHGGRRDTGIAGSGSSPGSKIDTTGGGKAVISLTDGSIVIIQPGSMVIFKDFHQASSLRELFEITLGQVRVKINHFAGKPNPYRMNSPTASVAVRGTEFTITVDRTGAPGRGVRRGGGGNESVRPLPPNPDRTGQGVLVAPGFDFQQFTPSARDFDDRARTGTPIVRAAKPQPRPSAFRRQWSAPQAPGGSPAQAVITISKLRARRRNL